MKSKTKEHRIIAMALSLLDKKMKSHPYDFRNPIQVIHYLRLKLEQEERETFVVLYLNNQNQLIDSEISSFGTINETSVYPREIAKSALKHNAAAIILAHNHPSGMPEPSNADRYITDRISESLSLFDIRTLDHFVIGHGEYVSFAERGWI